MIISLTLATFSLYVNIGIGEKIPKNEDDPRIHDTVEPALTTISQRPVFLVDSPYIDSCLNLSTTAISLQTATFPE